MSLNLASGATPQLVPATPITIVATISSGANSDVYTVPTGKTFYCTGFIVSGSSAHEAKIYVNAVLTITFAAGVIQASANGYPIFTATSGQVINFSEAGSAGAGSFNVWGFLL